MEAMTSLYASVVPQFTRDLLSPGLRVGYTDEGDVWQFLAPSLLQRLPLRAIEWRNLVGVTKRIEQLPLHFVEISVENVEKELPLTCLYLVKCEDFDTYKNSVRLALTNWVEAMTAANVEWLVLYVPLGTRSKASGNAPNPVYKKIFDRLRADFFVVKKAPTSLGAAMSSSSTSAAGLDKVCKIDVLEGTSFFGQQQQHESQWTDLVGRLRHCIMDAFEIKCFQYEEQLRVLDTQRGASGWDFGAFFLAKEQVALMYHQMSLQDDAIRHFDELDAIFVNLNEREKQPFQDQSTLLADLERDSLIFTQSPLSLDLDAMQHAIASNRASTRLISLYCFCRQMRTLYVMGTLPQLLQRAGSFIACFLVELNHVATQGALEWHQPFLWAVGACLEIAYACELAWSGRAEHVKTALQVSVHATSVEEMSRALGDVLYLARRILKSFAKATTCRHERPRALSGGQEHSSAHVPSTTWYRQLEHVFLALVHESEPCNVFEKCVSEISHVASMHFSQSGRHRFAVFLGGECAQYYLARGDFESASRLLRSVARQSQEDGWWTIYSASMRRICRAELALGRSTQAVVACFSLLQRTPAERGDGDTTTETEALLRALVTTLANKTHAARQRDENERIDLSPLFQPTILIETVQTSESDVHGQIRVTLTLTNEFSTRVHLDKVRLCFSSLVTGADKEIGGQDATVFMLEERNVCFQEHSGLTLVFRHSRVPRGHYICSQMEGVLAGISFPLVSSRAQALARFEMAPKETTVALEIKGAPILMRQPVAAVEIIAIEVRANNDLVVDGVLEVRIENCRVNRSDKSFDADEEACGIQLIGIQVLGEATASSFDVNPSKTSLRLGVPTLCRHETLQCRVSLELNVPARCWERFEDDCRFLVRASLCYHREGTRTSSSDVTTRAIQRAASSFRVLEPLRARVRLQRVATKLFTSIQLVSNPFVPLVLVDYQLHWPERGHDASRLVVVETDPNTNVRGTKLCPNAELQLAFTLATSPAFDQATDGTCHLKLALQDGEDDATWHQTTMVVPISLAEVTGTLYRIDIGHEERPDDLVDTCVPDPVTFRLCVQEQMARRGTPLAPDCYLWLDESSHEDWIVLGKSCERFVFAASTGTHCREFTTRKRLVPTRMGLVRFPAFRLQVNGQLIPHARVHCPQTSRHVLLS
ncbi:hypothetical protein PsorP6_005720 [Peronosclerospora sorghi]|uniref:Uncharacterized protein n=1 Tax=Peronosclerospora sorghi TaxID=230839 RepID=A0ACC0W2P6_9STRA|nr:hypothetical protein PsorP6_005720 [Peronosclerospora sorghi]